MTNKEIIMGVMIANEINEELHTFSKWKSLGYKVKRGEHGIEARLWKYNNKKQKEEVPEDADEDTKKKYHSGFYLAKSYLFTRSQVESMQEATQ